MSSIRNDNSKQKTTLSSYVWSLKDKEENYNLEWSVVGRPTSYKLGMKRCGLCDLEKLAILEDDGSKF